MFKTYSLIALGVIAAILIYIAISIYKFLFISEVR